ncbi:MAG: polysaccharide pyruvyl transferase family protein [Akkermansia sp.]|nr:polysaccharide pyruvyl transferase family protein [Akkermansia sp.]
MYHILPHPIVSNFGGILQAFALQKALCRLGIQSRVISFLSQSWRSHVDLFNLGHIVRSIKQLVLIILFARHKSFPLLFFPFVSRRFKRRFMKLLHVGFQRKQLQQISDEHAFIVGSDQVWRASYGRCIESAPFFFLNFASPQQRRQSIAYAASFGSDEWEGTPEETEECKRLVQEFKAVSVREHSGVRLCRDVFGVDAVQMPDPTLLLEQEDYNNLITQSKTHTLKSPFIATYLLDKSGEKQALTEALSKATGLYTQHLMYQPGAEKLMDRLPMSVPQWLRYIRDAECVLTDSFHGCVFCIIYNKPFICLGNENRGTARFDSLLGTFGLQERLITNPPPEQLLHFMRSPIDWEKVNSIRKAEQERAFDFLKNNLKKG